MLEALIAMDVSQREMRRQFDAGPDARRPERDVRDDVSRRRFRSALRAPLATPKADRLRARPTTSTGPH
jgi:hypothetical protein